MTKRAATGIRIMWTEHHTTAVIYLMDAGHITLLKFRVATERRSYGLAFSALHCIPHDGSLPDVELETFSKGGFRPAFSAAEQWCDA